MQSRSVRLAGIAAVMLLLAGCGNKGPDTSNKVARAPQPQQLDPRIYVRCDEVGRTELITGDSKKIEPAEPHNEIYRIDIAKKQVDVWSKADSAFEDRCNLSSSDDNSCSLKADDKLLTFVVRPRSPENGSFEVETLAFNRVNGVFEHERIRTRFISDSEFGFIWKGKGQCAKVEPPTSAPARF